MKQFVLLLGSVLVSTGVWADVQTREVTYRDGETVLRGYVAFDSRLVKEGAEATPRPGVLIVHQWLGLTDYEKGRARQLAALGYVAFALDIYGVDQRPKDPSEAGPMAGKFKGDRALFRRRLNLGLQQLLEQREPAVDPRRVVAIGYCFGGTGVLELARSGADIAGIVSFHGGLDSPTPEDGKNIRCKVLICHGAADPYVPRDDIAALKKELADAGVDWQMIEYSGAVHSFTQPMAGNDPSRGAAYHEKADRRSWQHMQFFLDEVLGPVK
ncbi:MAG: dienelactone hydrolase family protein [Planctomycetes bacterium]|nr:dienelactone hydrolase family protein [Planctomycetota bacterium]